jgi:tetratricopeptide (TPR) repeat protein
MLARIFIALCILSGWIQFAMAQGSADRDACMAAGRTTDYVAVIKSCTGVLESNPDNFSALTNRGWASGKAGKHDDAIRDSSRAIEIDAKVAAPYLNRANAYVDLHNFDAAMADFDRAIALDPKLAIAYNDRGTAFGEQRQHERAIADFSHAILLDPKQGQFYFNRGLAYLRIKQDDLAAHDFETVLEFDPDHAWANKDLADILLRREKYNDARLHYTSAIRWQPNQPSFYRGRALAYLGGGEYDSAIEDAEHVLTLDTKAAEALGLIGFARFLSGDFTAAATTFDLDLRSGSKSPHAMIYRSLAQLRGKADVAPALDAYLGTADLSRWPGPLLGYLQGSVTEEAMLKTLSDAPPSTKCQARFALGEVALAHGETETATRQFQEAVTICPKSMPDYMGAKAELNKLR